MDSARSIALGFLERPRCHPAASRTSLTGFRPQFKLQTAVGPLEQDPSSCSRWVRSINYERTRPRHFDVPPLGAQPVSQSLGPS